MSRQFFYPLRFEPIYQYRLWGGRHLADLLRTPLPDNEPIGEAWLLSDRDDHQSLVANGPLQGHSIGQLMKQYPEQMLGRFAGRYPRFPLLLKFLDVHEMLSVQVHPSDAHQDLLPPGESGKTEAWVVLEATANSRIYTGLKSGTTEDNLRKALAKGSVEEHLASFIPKEGNSILIPAGTVHALGGDVVVFEIQQNSDVTFKLYDWNHIDPRTGKPRELQVDKALACIDFSQQEVSPKLPVVEQGEPALRERLITCKYFGLWRVHGEKAFQVGQADEPRVVVCTAGKGALEYQGDIFTFAKGDVILLPAIVGACLCKPQDTVTLLETFIPEGA